MTFPFSIVTASTDADTLDALDAVAASAFGSATYRQQFDWHAATEPGGVFACLDGDRPIGTACTIAYPDAGFGWIGLVATLPGYERRGIGRALTERAVAHLAAAGCRSVLDASRFGAPVYERMGFDDFGPTTVLTRAERDATDAISRPPGTTVRSFHASDLAALVALDAAAFGVARSDLIGAMVDDLADRTLVAVRGGTVVGFAIAQPVTIGPVVADDPSAVAALVTAAAALPWDDTPRLLVPPGSPHLGVLGACGFEPARELRHMRLECPTLPTDPQRYVARATLGVG